MIEKSFFEYFEIYEAECGSNLFLFDENRKYTVTETFREAIAIGNRLYDCGVRSGSLVALRSTRSLDAFLIYLGLQFLGATAVLTGPHQTVSDFFRDTGVAVDPQLVITNEAAAQGISANGNWQILGHGPLDIGYPARAENRRFPVGKDLRAPSTIVFTSGSTGKGKGAMLSQESLLQYAEDSVVQPWHQPDDIAIVTLPTQHGFALCLLSAAIVARYALFFPRDMATDYILECIEKYRITRINGVPSYMLVLAYAAEVHGRDISSLRTGFTAGAPIVPEQHRYIEETLGMTLHPLYGMSESISISCTAPTDSAHHRATTVGKFHRNAGSIVGPDGKELPQGQEGEICVSGPAIMKGYYGDPEATALALDAQGRLHTGDLGYIDDEGYVHISGRIKDIIIRNGVNLSPAKIEAGLRQIPGVKNALVVGLRHDVLGEAPYALVVPETGADLSEDYLSTELLTRIPKNHIPLAFRFAPEIPLNKIGKPDKMAVKKLFQE